jgi:hypothetical protein
MLAKRFTAAAERVRKTELAEDAIRITAGRTRDGRQVQIYRGRAPGESIRDSLGYFVIISAQSSDAVPNPDSSSRRDVSQATVEVIPAGSRDVFHPSYGRYTTPHLRISSGLGQLIVLSEQNEQVLLNGEPIYPEGQEIPPLAEATTPTGVTSVTI